jgi:hypothetical protein
MNKQKLALFVVLVVLVLAVAWSFISAPRLKTVSSTAPAQKQQTAKATPAAVARPVPVAKPPVASDERTLRLDLLEREQSGFKGYRRNLFKPIFIDDIKFMKQKSVATKPLPLPPVAVAPVAPIPVPDPAEIAAQVHQKTLAQFTYLGYLKKDNRKTIFLSKDKEIILVRKGEKFAKRYEATNITEQALTIKVIDSGDEIVIPLAENKPLAMPRK